MLEEMKMNNDLPVTGFRDQIVKAVKDHSVVVITAETGAGKSTQVPQYLLDAGYDLVVTQPRRLAARTVAERVAEEYGCPFGGVVGYRTATDRQDSAATRCLFVTDGLALVRELMGAGTHNVLVLDEVHEWNLNIEVLVAWARKRLGEEAGFKVVLMSATLEADRLAAYFGGAPVISVPGRLFPVEVKKPGMRVVDDVAELARAGRNVLTFQPGKAEIEATIAELTRQGVDAEILPLHGELSADEQRRCFKRYGRSKVVVSTNVAQTSVTIDDIDAVVDSGMERRVELVDGVEGLYLKPISLADSKQRAGRAGRTKPGVYIDHCAASMRPEFPKAEILRTRLDQTVLRLAEAGFDMEELTFFHQPDQREIHDAKRALKALGCMNEDGKVTPIGRKVAKLPVSVQFGRMIVEADKFGVVGDVLTIAAILELGEITARPRDRYETPAWRQLCASERESDVLAQLAVYNTAEGMSKTEMVENGVFVKAFFKAKEIRRHLEGALRGKVRSIESTGKRDDIVRSLCSGMVDHLYQRTGYGWRNGEGVDRELNRDSVITASGDWLVGLPFDLEIKARRGGTMTLRLIRMATKVNPRMLAEAAPQLVRLEEHLTPTYDSEKDVVVSTTRTFFNNHMIGEEKHPDGEHEQAASVFASWVAAQFA